MRWRRVAALAAPLVFAQAAGPVSAFAQQVCTGHRIRAIRVQSYRLFAIEPEPFGNIFQVLGNGLSWRTQPATVRRELRFAEGMPCDSTRLAESARLLRAQPYLRSADITTVPVPNGDVDVEVLTRDEFGLSGSFRFDAQRGRALKAFRITEDNLFGRGMLGQLRYDYFGRRAGFVAGVLHRQAFGTNDAELVGGRSSVGPVGELSLRREFESEFDRYAWRADLRWREEPFLLRSDQFGTVTMPIVSTGWDLGLARRSGPVGRQTVVGVAASFERLFPNGTAIAAEPALDTAASAQVAGRFGERRRLSTDVFWGYRNVRFVRHRGLDGVDAPQDVREGFELRGILGHGWDVGGSVQRDWFLLLEGYLGGAASAHTLAFLRGRIEGRYLVATQAWDGIVAAADFYTYTTLGERGTLFAGIEGAGGWRTSTPFQLLVSSPEAMRGFGLAAKPAGRRVVAQAEHRYLLGSVFGAADVGSTLFVDVGGGWAGDAAFGRDTGLLVSAGAGLRVAFPVGSRVTSRLDFAVPLRGGRGLEVRLSLRRPFGLLGSEADDVERSRLPVSTLEPFHFSRY